MRLVVVGVGNLGSAIVRSLLHSYSPHDLVLVERNPQDRERLKVQHGCHVVRELSSEYSVKADDLLILVVKPQDALLACTNIAPFLSQEAVVLSLMAGVRTATLASILKNRKIVRAMPNLGASIDESATGYYCSAELAPSEIQKVEVLLSRLGKTWRVEREELVDGLTAVAGTGPAYLCWLGEQVERVAVELGLSSQEAHAILLQTFRGTILYLEQSGITFAELRTRVTSPQGTTAAAMSVLKERAADESVREAVQAACKRAAELGG